MRAAGVQDLLSAYAAGSLDPVAVLARLKGAVATNLAGPEAILSFVPGAEAAAETSRRRWANGNPRPLEGIPFGVKAIIDVAGAAITCGSWLTGDRIAPADAEVVASLRQAGAIPFAMTATTEFAAGSPHNPRHGVVRNPWDRSRWTGGSSTGSAAALAAGLMPFALGTDTGGSIRVPSCWCGTTGLKPTRELVSRHGVATLSATLDHVGPMARSAADIAKILPFMTGTSAGSGTPLPEVTGLRIGIFDSWFTDSVSASVAKNWHTALADLEHAGCTVTTLPAIDIATWHAAGWTILLSELAANFGAEIGRADSLDRGFLARLEQGLAIPTDAYDSALAIRDIAQHAFAAAMDGVDLVLTPGIGGEAGRLDSLTVDIDGTPVPFGVIISRNTMLFDLLGLPALMLPSGLGSNGMPTGMQIVGRPGDDALCLALGIAFQSRTAHHLARPPSC